MICESFWFLNIKFKHSEVSINYARAHLFAIFISCSHFHWSLKLRTDNHQARWDVKMSKKYKVNVLINWAYFLGWKWNLVW